MTEEPSGATFLPTKVENEVSLLAVGSVLLRWRRPIVVLGFLGGLTGLVSGLTSPKLYRSTATFVTTTSTTGGASGLALAASQFGIAVPSAGGGWGPSMYVELMTSRALLLPVLMDTVVVAEEGNRHATLIDLLEVPSPEQGSRLRLAVDALSGAVEATEDKKLGIVHISVTTRWPSVSLALARRLLQRVNEFNLETRRGQATSERKFIAEQLGEAEHALRQAEDRLQIFLQRNRASGSSPELTFERERIQREVSLRQQLYVSWLQSREEARVREVRNTPVISVFEEPQLPFAVEPRRSARKGVLGGLIGGLLALIVAFAAHGISSVRAARTEDAQQFLRQWEEAFSGLGERWK